MSTRTRFEKEAKGNSEMAYLCNCVEKPEKFSAFTAQLVRALHRYRDVKGSNPVEILNFIAIIPYLLMIFLVMSCYLSNSKRKT